MIDLIQFAGIFYITKIKQIKLRTHLNFFTTILNTSPVVVGKRNKNNIPIREPCLINYYIDHLYTQLRLK